MSSAAAPCGREVLLGERQHRRHRLARGVGHQGGHVDRHRPVAVGADAEAVDVLAEVHVLVLMAQDRQAGLRLLGVAADECGDLSGAWRTGAPSAPAARRGRPAWPAGHPRTRPRTPRCRRRPRRPSCAHRRPGRPRRRFRRPRCAGRTARRGRWRVRPAPRRRARPWPARRRACGSRRGRGRRRSADAAARIRPRLSSCPRSPTPPPSPPCGAGRPAAPGWWPPRGRRPG